MSGSKAIAVPETLSPLIAVMAKIVCDALMPNEVVALAAEVIAIEARLNAIAGSPTGRSKLAFVHDEERFLASLEADRERVTDLETSWQQSRVAGHFDLLMDKLRLAKRQLRESVTDESLLIDPNR